MRKIKHEKTLTWVGALVTIIFIGFGIWSLFAWYRVAPPQPLTKRVAVPENHRDTVKIEKINIEGEFRRFDGTPGRVTGSWPWFRGIDHNNIAIAPGILSDHWGSSGPPVLWSVNLGEGHAGPAVKDGCVYLLDYDESAKSDSLRCFSLDNGAELWRRSYRVSLKRNHGMSRTVPAVTDRYVVTIGPKCQVMCVDARNGNYQWGLDLADDFGTKVPLWYTAQCPFIDGSQVILAPCGKLLMMGVDLATGKVVWQTPNPGNYQMSHSSIVPMTIGRQKMYVYAAIGGMVGVAAGGPRRGEVLWQTQEWNPEVMAPTPVILPGNRIFVTAGYGAGSMMFQISQTESSFSVKPLFRLSKEVFACEQQTPVFYQDHLFGVLPNDAGPLKRQLVCLDLNGQIVWSSGKENRFGYGPLLIAADKILILNDDGELTLAKASASGYVQLARAKVLPGKDSWGPMAMVNGRLLLRDSTQLRCLDLRAMEDENAATGNQ